MLKRTLAALAAASLLTLAACGDGDGESSEPKSTGTTGEPTEATSNAAAEGCEYLPGGQPAREVEAPPTEPTHSGTVSATLETNLGDIGLELDADAAPCTVNSFLSLAEQDFYDETPCPRLGYQPGFAILQCGDPSGTTGGGPGYTFADELTGTETYPQGTIAMANAGPDTNGSQFFLVFEDSAFPPSYTVFGTIDDAGVELLLEVGKAGDDGTNAAGGGAPKKKVTIENVVVDD